MLPVSFAFQVRDVEIQRLLGSLEEQELGVELMEVGAVGEEASSLDSIESDTEGRPPNPPALGRSVNKTVTNSPMVESVMNQAEADQADAAKSTIAPNPCTSTAQQHQQQKQKDLHQLQEQQLQLRKKLQRQKDEHVEELRLCRDEAQAAVCRATQQASFASSRAEQLQREVEETREQLAAAQRQVKALQAKVKGTAGVAQVR